MRALKWAVANEYATRNVAQLVDGPKNSKQANLDDALDRDQSIKVLTTVNDDPMEVAAVLGLKLALRISEVCALRRSDCDFAKKELHVRRSKTASGVRTLPMIPDVERALKTRFIHQKREKLAAGPLWRDSGYVLTMATGRDVNTRWLRTWWHKRCSDAGVGHHRFHAARHTAATLMLDDGVPLEVVSAILGHKSLTITADIYAKVTKDAMRRTLVNYSNNMKDTKSA